MEILLSEMAAIAAITAVSTDDAVADVFSFTENKKMGATGKSVFDALGERLKN